jgi:hypothetical protein
MEILKNFLYRTFFKDYQNRKLFMIGLSHILNVRKNYHSIKNFSDLDFKIFSQNGEDGILDYILYQLKIEKPKFLEIGVGDYSESNTRFIFDRCSPKGTIIDCIENFENRVKNKTKLWKGELNIIKKDINPDNIKDVIDDKKIFSNLDLFSLDIDGIDYWILEKLPNNFSKIAVLEFNPTFGSNLKVTVPNINNFNRNKYHHSNLCFGMSLKAAIDIMDKKNFYFLGTNLFKNNAFFVSNNFKKNDYFQNLNIDSFESHTNANFTESRDTNGKLNYLSGEKKILEIGDCKLMNLDTLEEKKINEIYNFEK